jgi:hypothetical protein
MSGIAVIVIVIVIDVQQMFFSGPAAAHRAREVIDGINSMTMDCRVRP